MLEPRLIPPIAGFTSALVEISILWPFEYGKTMAQLNRNNPDFSVVKHIRQEGLAIYKGLTPLLVGAPIQGLIRFSSLDYFNNLLRDKNTKRLSRMSGLIAGIFSGVLESVLIVVPMETVKTLLIDSKQGIISGVRNVLKKDGIRGIYKGVMPTAAKSASNQALRFVIYNEYKSYITADRVNKNYLSPVESLAGGMLAGLLGAIGNTPFDTVKSRMQGLDSKRYSGMFDCFKKMVREEGFFSLYKGLGYRCSRVVPGQGIIFLVYEFVSTELKEFSLPGRAEPKKLIKIQRMNSIGSD